MAKTRSNRAVAVETLDAPERDAPPLATPEDGSSLRARLRAASVLKPEDAHFLAAWTQGRDSTVAEIEAGTSVLAIRNRRIPSEGIGCRDCWARGRDAVLRVIEG